ncbi:alpha/beta hydrolase [Parapusillimonas sp. SGNA-6]|nr:alpha/beta hydrolase [Parapusillimonas sp. SGNA-6]
MAFIDSSGVKLYVEETGSGYPIVFVHELAADSREWEGQVKWFSRHYRCITFNARGYRPSDVPDDPQRYGYEFAVEDIAAVMRGLRLERAHVVGLSMGAYATLCFGLRYPERASALVAAGVGSGSPAHLRQAFIAEHKALAQQVRQGGVAAVGQVAQQVGSGPTRIRLKEKDPRGWDMFMQHLAEHDPVGLANTLDMFQGSRPSLEHFKDGLSKLDVPVLLAVGDEDNPCLETNLFLKRTLPDARLWVVPMTGHSVNLEECGAFNAVVQDFLHSVESAAWSRSASCVEEDKHGLQTA